jgi:hypothetical protein
LRRTLIFGGLVAMLSFATGALGSTKHYRGPIEQGGHVTFDTKVKHHKTKKVKRFYFFDVKLKCDENTLRINNRTPFDFPVPPMKVKHRRFHGDFYNADFKTGGHVKGEFTNHFKNAEGTLRVRGNPAGLHNCDTGTVDWTARKQ